MVNSVFTLDLAPLGVFDSPDTGQLLVKMLKI